VGHRGRHRLSEAAEIPTITLQVISFEAGAHSGMPGSFVIIKFPGDEDPDVVYIDSMAGDLFLETEPEIQRYTLAFEHLRAVALSPAESRALLASIAEVT
jgi:hypothetical protein